ncbi:unnamed protein product [Thelazia callipaeda]|uniref:Cubilin n=1 Tax=Thelazia callipaeda TaxID=103827 RepID=A0A0N5CJU8_THECL|nr:unnamed protein product [Thelazia callipaeda]
MAQMRTLERVVEARINLLNFEKEAETKQDCSFCRNLDCDIIFAFIFTCIIFCLLIVIMVFWLKGVLSYEDSIECDHIFDSSTVEGEFQLPMLPAPSTRSEYISRPDGPKSMQCIYTFVAGPRQRVKLNFDQFLLAGTTDNCETEYVDIYSELENPDDDLLSASFGGRYCGTISPYVRISLNRVIVLVFHSRYTSSQSNALKFRGRYAFISDGEKTSNFRCTYLLKGKTGQRVRLLFRDFDIYFGGEHCPYDLLTIYDGPSNAYPIIRKVCGLQQRMEIYSFGPKTYIEFNTTSPAKADPRGFSMDYEFSSRYVDVLMLMNNQLGVTHLRGSECDLRIESNRESTHYIQSPKYPLMYPANTTCTFIIDGLQGAQNLEKVILTFENFAVLTENAIRQSSTDYEDEPCATSYVGIALLPASIKSVLASGEESNYDATLCDRLQNGSRALGPYVSNGPRMVVVFSSNEKVSEDDGLKPLGFRAKIQFKTDFGIPGEPIGDSNQCMFLFTKPQGWFNSPRYPTNYPLDTNCTYIIKAKQNEQIQVYFEQFALHVDEKSSTGNSCSDFVEISDVFIKNGLEYLQLQARYCANTFPGPTVTAFGSHELRVFFRSDHEGTGNGFKAIYRIRKAFAEEIPTNATARHCGQRIKRTDQMTSGWFVSPGYPIKYNKDLICDWEITVRPDYQILLHLIKMEIEGSITSESVNCQNAVIRIDAERDSKVTGLHRIQEICGTDESVIEPIVSKSNVARIRFFTSPDKVNGLKGFNFTWTEVKLTTDDTQCSHSSQYLCTYTKLCIDVHLRCNGDENCGGKLENAADMRTIIYTAGFSSCILVIIVGFFCYVMKKKLEEKKRKRRHHAKSTMQHKRKPFRNPKPFNNKGDPQYVFLKLFIIRSSV